MNGKTINISLELNSDTVLFKSNDFTLFEQPIEELKFNDDTISFFTDI